MTLKRFAVTMLMAVLALAGCDVVPDQAPPSASSETASAPAEEPPSSDPAPTADADGQTVTGTLSGDAQLEGGCVWLETDTERFEVLWPEGYRADVDPIELRDPTGAVIATEGDRLTVHGEPAPERMSSCQIGALWEATDVAPEH